MTGKGLIAIAESCLDLKKIDLSKCGSVQNWSLSKVFFDCRKLEEVNISYLDKIGDEEVRLLAQHCPYLMTLHAKECPYISDQALLAVSHHCLEIDYIDLSRTTLSYRISDVSLLALGKKSISLRVLKINGCDHVTDVGLNWYLLINAFILPATLMICVFTRLAEGCKAIEELEIANCHKITNAGLRGIGNNCHKLHAIDISGLRLVSDIGVTSIAMGCPKLKKLICQGLYLLADSRLNVPKKGESRCRQRCQNVRVTVQGRESQNVE
jgi:F-box/leucine-rich repeat protein 2/20